MHINENLRNQFNSKYNISNSSKYDHRNVLKALSALRKHSLLITDTFISCALLISNDYTCARFVFNALC